MEDDLLPISALQHYAYCPRQFALIHVEQVWEENRYTAEGRLLHERVDAGVAEQRKDIRYERGVLLNSQRYGLVGKMDLLEVVRGNPPRYVPVEYKRGKPKLESWDRIQLCAQALCLEEMRSTTVQEGAIWYWEVRRREHVVIDTALRDETLQVLKAARAVLHSCETPMPTLDKRRCRACSLVDVCNPAAFRIDHSEAYMQALYEGDDPSITDGTVK